MSSPCNWTRKFLEGTISRREFVERAAYGGLSAATTTAVLAAASRARAQGENSAATPGDYHQTAPYANPDQTNDDPFNDWLNSENIPVISGYGVSSLRMLELKPWARMGAAGAHIRLVGSEGVDAAYVCEIPPSGSTKPQRYLFEEVIYVLNGEGETAIWTSGSDKQTVRWQTGSIISPPLNTWRQHFNRGAGSARFVSINNAPVVIDLFHNLDFVFNNEFAFRDRYSGSADDFRPADQTIYPKKVPPHPPMRNYEGKVVSPAQSGEGKGLETCLSAFVPDARSLGLAQLTQRGVGNSRIELEMGNNTMQSHISQFAIGTYKTAHRHGPGSHVLMLNGTGYTLMWFGPTKYSQADQKVRVDFGEASLVVPPDRWWHQHFNIGPEAARYLACTWGGDGRWFMEAIGGGGRTHLLAKTSTRVGGNMIDYEDEDPIIREIYAAELAGAGIAMKMPGAK
jgi:quercetin dioxygenase-like cupin family protein